MSFKSRALIAAGLLALAGCNTMHNRIGSGDKRFGEAVKYDTAIQIINPEPVYAPDGALPGEDGAKAAAAYKRYRTDAVKAVEDIKTSKNTNSGSSGSK